MSTLVRLLSAAKTHSFISWTFFCVVFSRFFLCCISQPTFIRCVFSCQRLKWALKIMRFCESIRIRAIPYWVKWKKCVPTPIQHTIHYLHLPVKYAHVGSRFGSTAMVQMESDGKEWRLSSPLGEIKECCTQIENNSVCTPLHLVIWSHARVNRVNAFTCAKYRAIQNIPFSVHLCAWIRVCVVLLPLLLHLLLILLFCSHLYLIFRQFSLLSHFLCCCLQRGFNTSNTQSCIHIDDNIICIFFRFFFIFFSCLVLVVLSLLNVNLVSTSWIRRKLLMLRENRFNRTVNDTATDETQVRFEWKIVWNEGCCCCCFCCYSKWMVAGHYVWWWFSFSEATNTFWQKTMAIAQNKAKPARRREKKWTNDCISL